MSQDELAWLGVTEAGERIAAGTLSPVELTEAVLARIARLNPALHAYLTVLPERARAAARRAADELAAGRRRGPLHGVPVAVKDLCDLRGTVTSCASTVRGEAPATRDAAVVTRLDAAGAVIVGKTHLTEFALMGYHPSLPRPRNPWNRDFDTGGSSSGSGVAVAAGMACAAIGTDTGGSIRIPSAWCGVTGLKPTFGRVSRAGVFPLGTTLDHVGPMARSVADAALMLDVLAGVDPADPTTRRAPLPSCAEASAGGVAGLRLGWDDAYVAAGAPPYIAAAARAALDVLAAHGAQVVEVRLPPVDELLAAWPVLCGAEALAAHADAGLFPARAAAYGNAFRTFLEYAQELSAAEYARHHTHRIEWAGGFAAVFEQCDLFACPSTFMTAPPLDVLDVNGPFSPAIAPFMRFTAPFNFSGSPTLSVPCGFSPDGLPYSLQLVGPHDGEPLLCRAGHAYQQATDWHRRRPALSAG
ncbi:MAG: amidase [Deltaproteobacteria bacterium]|nr:amidase [Deltaproteobacteria bacterium]